MGKPKNFVFIGIFLFIINTIESQQTELARIEYTYIPQASSDNIYDRFRISINYPIKINEKGTYLIINPDYRLDNLKINDVSLSQKRDFLSEFHTGGVELGYTFKMKNDWRFGTKLGIKISSNFEESGIQNEDLRYTGALYFVKSYKNKQEPKTALFVFGVKYTTPASLNFPLPILNYYSRFHSSWSYSVGTPKSSIKYYFNKKNTIQAFIGLDQFYSNLQKNQVFVSKDGEEKIAENISMLNIISALGYECFFTEHLLLYGYLGYTLSNEIRLRDNDQKDVKIIQDKNTFYFRSGIKYKI
ncbi:hypothetical protein [Aquimarina muelleri]|uniref:Uncharacterized protein n=1 Tax=Aquimarina muelleri TaxID=279356 RepID=A0A918N4J6_9FLAO|nr:hypothetical protein [Aquimarina muelleri]MCX2764558.1 hypothetical protein [Aquimarina muelleri]GGX23060.1 hypothetical protein GCM10007384_25320 [Aquimarina muelleri]